MQVEYFFDCSSPWTYLSFAHIESLCDARDAELVWKPILVGGVFNTVNPSVYAARGNPVPVKARYSAKDLQDWARLRGIRIGSPPVFPVNSVKAMRGAFVALEAGCISAYTRTVFERYWGELDDISQDSVMRDIAAGVGLDPDAFMAEIGTDARKSALRRNTDELIERGGFGSPTMFLDGTDMYFGNDRLVLLDAAMAARSATA